MWNQRLLVEKLPFVRRSMAQNLLGNGTRHETFCVRLQTPPTHIQLLGQALQAVLKLVHTPCSLPSLIRLVPPLPILHPTLHPTHLYSWGMFSRSSRQ